MKITARFHHDGCDEFSTERGPIDWCRTLLCSHVEKRSTSTLNLLISPMIAVVNAAKVANEKFLLGIDDVTIKKAYSDSRDGKRKRLFSGTLQFGSKHMSLHPRGQIELDSKRGHFTHGTPSAHLKKLMEFIDKFLNEFFKPPALTA